MNESYVVRVTTRDWDEFTYRVHTSGALAAVESATFAHHKAGHMLSDVRSVVASASGEHESADDQAEVCPTCGQPDNSGDCNHQPLTEADWARLPGLGDRA